MSFVPNYSQQLTFDDQYYSLTKRERKFLANSWATYFAENIFPKINEQRFSVLYSDNPATRPGTPVNVIIGALLLKELCHLSDDGIMNSLMFDYRFQYALHTTSMVEQPLSDRTLGRFRARCLEYEEKTDIDLIHEEMKSLSADMATMMNIDGTLLRMDSMMIASNIKNLSRMELLYTCLSNLIIEMNKNGVSLPVDLLHYAEKDDRNQVVYHNQSHTTDEKVAVILSDCAKALLLCDESYEDSSNYILLKRVLSEQTILEEDGTYRLRTREDKGMHGNILQNPADPDATYRNKAGEGHKGYSGNIVEAVGEYGSIITDYALEQNTHSDSSFAKEVITAMGKQVQETTLVADGAYGGVDNVKLAKDNNINLITTNLTGRSANVIHADFKFNESGTEVIQCPAGHKPKSCNYIKASGQCVISFCKSQCESCPYFKDCKPVVKKRTCKKNISIKSKQRAEQQRFRSSKQFSELTKIRNGVETVPSFLRRAYNVDRMPVRGLHRCKMFLGFKIVGANINKFCKYMRYIATNGLNMAVA